MSVLHCLTLLFSPSCHFPLPACRARLLSPSSFTEKLELSRRAEQRSHAGPAPGCVSLGVCVCVVCFMTHIWALFSYKPVFVLTTRREFELQHWSFAFRSQRNVLPGPTDKGHKQLKHVYLDQFQKVNRHVYIH